MSALTDIVTTADGESHDLGRWSWVLSFAAVSGLAGWNVWHGVPVTPRELAESLGIVAAAHGAALFMKRETEPKP